MIRLRALVVGLAVLALFGRPDAVAAQAAPPAAGRGAAGGTIRGHIALGGKVPGNAVIRMGLDPMCAKLNAGKLTVQEIVAATADGSLGNVFVRLQGSFPKTPVPAGAVMIDQKGCIYTPRVVGVQIGQTLQVRNSDALLHNVHSLSAKDNSFNVGQPMAGMVNQFKLKTEEIMLRLRCDLHTWMTAYVAVVSNPYFAVSDKTGTFQIANVPPGTYTIQAWHERYGSLAQTVRVQAGAAAEVKFSYTGNEKPPTAAIHDLTIHETLIAGR